MGNSVRAGITDDDAAGVERVVRDGISGNGSTIISWLDEEEEEENSNWWSNSSAEDQFGVDLTSGTTVDSAITGFVIFLAIGLVVEAVVVVEVGFKVVEFNLFVVVLW